MDQQDPTLNPQAPNPVAKAPVLSPQTLAVLAVFISFAGGVAASRGLISKETADYFASPEAMAFVGTIGAAAVAGWRAWANRPHGIIKSAAALPQVDAVITRQKTANEIPAGNVVGSIEDAAKVVPSRGHTVPIPTVKHPNAH
jgi:hypothetical protein